MALYADESNEEEDAFQQALAASMEGFKGSDEGALKEVDEAISEKKETCLMKKPAYPPLPEEPKGDRNLLCRVGVRFPDGRRVQRNFLRTDPIQVIVFLLSSTIGLS
ncbi:plant UBX domain-containing protein 7 [Olea europaea var. sylvestris]|uniref:plant UBX domain-containing protein 7 n=1 Tax=Olea europaea var. sylvestris TaxID=158386 RepID=UPI000C1D1EF7|nr:plant UBX domain-containing protein 7 [Olea europaea var. sylvestris]